MALRTLYLQEQLSINGRNAIAGRALYDRFCQLSEEALLGHVVYSDEDAARVKDQALRSDVVSYTLLRDFRPNVLFVEGGLFANPEGVWKVPQEIATEVCHSGGVLIVADVDHNQLYRHKALYRTAGLFFKAFASYRDDDPIYGSDEQRFWGGCRQILCVPAKMVIADWIRPVYEGVPEILVGLPVQLSSWETLVASCNSDTTSTLHGDYFVDNSDPCPFAAAAQIGSGFAVLIAGLVSDDVWLKGCPYNTAWLTNMATFLVKEGEADHARRMSYRRSPQLLFLSHRSTDRNAVSKVAGAIKRRGLNVWFAEEQLIPSQSLTAELSRALGEMTHFVLFWSASCVGAPWVGRELSSAIALLVEKKIPLVIVRLDQTPVPEIVADILRIEAFGEAEDVVAARIVEVVDRLRRKGA